MTIAEKLTLIAENQPKIFEKGKQAGESSDNGVAKLMFETTFSVSESQTHSTDTTIATISTGFTVSEAKEGDELYCVIQCTHDTDTDTSYNHFKARTHEIAIGGGNYANAQGGSGVVFTDNSKQYGAAYGLYLKSTGKYAATINVQSRGHVTWGFVPSGDYSFKVYKLNHDFFGLGGM